MKNKYLLTVFLILLYRSVSIGTTTYVSNDVGLLAALTATNPSPVPGDIIQITDDIDVSNLSLPLVVPSGVIVQGNYDLLSVPNSNGSTYSNVSTSPFRAKTITSSKRVDFNLTGNVVDAFIFKLLPGIVGQPTTIRNIRLKGPQWNWVDYNNNNLANNTIYVSGGIFLDYSGSSGYFEISHNEIFGFSFAGVYGYKGETFLNFDHNYIHHIKGIMTGLGIGYANWFQSNANNSDINSTNNIYDDCKEAIDGQSGISNWTINNCTLTQFFYGGIGKHAGNLSFTHDPNPQIIPPPSSPCKIFYSDPTFEPTDNPFNVYDVAGGNVDLINNISHFDLGPSGGRGGLCGFPYPLTQKITQTANYSPLICSSATVLASNGQNNSTTNFIGDLNDGGWTNVPLGFNFNFFGNSIPYTTCSISTNGFIQFGTQLSLADTTAAIRNNNYLTNFIAICLSNLDFSSTAAGNIQYCTSGNPGNQVFEVEWTNGLYHNYVDATHNIHLPGYFTGHIKLFEQDGSIEIHLLNQTINAPSNIVNGQAWVPDTNFKEILGYEKLQSTGILLKNANNFNYTSPTAFRFESPISYDITLSGNTLVAPLGLTDEYVSIYNRGGFATIADNYIGSCTWNGDPHLHWNTPSPGVTNNSFIYRMGNTVATGCPQPPECNIQLKDQSNVNLPKTNIDLDHSPRGYNYINSGSPINISVSPGSLGSQTNAYIIRPNPELGGPVGNGNTSGNNSFFDDLTVLGPATGTQTRANYIYDVSKPGLHGIDVLAVAATNSSSPLWGQYNASAWTHQPLISIPSYGESHLIFNIKDSYSEPYPPVTSPPLTHVLKTAELNGHRIWQEDIALGGDGWERIDIPLIGNPNIDPSWIVPSSNETGKNILTFSINFESPMLNVPISAVRGVSVWVDDVYINRYSSSKGTNLISDGDLENETCGKLGTYLEACNGNPCRDHCSWFKNSNGQTDYPVVCNYQTSSSANSSTSSSTSSNEESLYNDGNTIPVIASNPYRCDAYLSGRERKSGQTSIVLNLPIIATGDCINYTIQTLADPPSILPIPINTIYHFFPGVVSAYTQFEFPYCGSFSDDLEDQFTDLNAASAPPISGSFNLNHNITLASGSTLEFNNTTLSIGPGVSITVPDNSTLNITASNFSGCSDMWRGIIVEKGGTVNISSSSTIADAQYGIQAESGTTVDVNDATFTDNYIGMDLTSVGAVGAATIAASVTNTTFQSTALKNGYLNQTPTPLTHTFKGINIDNNTFLNIGGGASSDNIFSGLNYGIVSVNSNVNVEHSVFRDIKKYDNYLLGISAFHHYNGTAIIGVGNFTNTISVNGNSSSSLEFENCQTGIRVWKMNAECFDLNSDNCDVGINVSSQDNCNSKIHNNELNCNSYGIIGLLNDYANSFSIYENKIDVGSRLNLDGGVPNAIAIFVGGNSVKNTNRLIKLNEIKLHDFAQHGIFGNAVYGYTIDHNYVNMYNANSNLTGISLTQGRQCTLNCNSISGTGSVFTYDQQAAMWFQDSPENTISCNTVQKTYTGIGFMGTCIGGSGTNLHSNDIGEHNIGLYYKGTATRVDEQRYKGNSWYYNNYSVFGAWDEDLTWAATDRYSVDQTGPRFPNGSALTNHPTPNTNQIISEVWPLVFIKDDIGADENCGHQLLPNEITCGIGTGGGDGGSDRRAALNLEGSQDFDEETKWKTRERLYEKLLNEPNYLDSDTVYVNFFQQMTGSYLKQIAQLNKNKDEIYINSQSMLQTINTRTLQINLNTTQIAKCDSLLHLDGISTAVVDSLKLARYNIVQNTSQLLNQNNADLALVKTAKENRSDVLNADNAMINSSKIYEQNEKQINEAYLQMIYKDHLELLPNFSSQILSIAAQCPLSGGPAVYKARTLAALIDPDLRYDDQLTHSEFLLIMKLP